MATVTETKAAATEVAASVNILEHLTEEQKAALINKYLTFPKEVRNLTESQYPTISDPCALYILRQMIREADSKSASILRPAYIERVKAMTRSLVSTIPDTRNAAHRVMREIADEIEDGAEAKKICKAVKVKLDMSSSDPAIVTLCGIFGITPQSIA